MSLLTGLMASARKALIYLRSSAVTSPGTMSFVGSMGSVGSEVVEMSVLVGDAGVRKIGREGAENASRKCSSGMVVVRVNCDGAETVFAGERCCRPKKD